MGSRLDITGFLFAFHGTRISGLHGGYLQLFAFLREELDGLQSRYLQSASSLPSEVEVTTESK